MVSLLLAVDFHIEVTSMLKSDKRGLGGTVDSVPPG